MRKRTLLGLVLALALALTACGGGQPAQESYDASAVQAAADAGAFSEELDTVDADTAYALYQLANCGLEREELAECTVLRSSGATCEEIAVLVLSDSAADKMDAVKQAMSDYIQGQIDANVSYRPAEIPKLENALIDQRGNSLLLVVANDLEAAKGAIK